MPGRIPSTFIDDLLSRVDIVEVIDEYVPLAKAGRDHKACCPFHAEKTPSFTVSGAKQFYHCFGCQAHGSAISFLMDYARLGFVEAVEELAGRVGLALPENAGDAPAAPSSAPLLDLLDRASRFYRRQLRRHPAADRARNYLQSRGVSGEVARTFDLGFAPPGWDNLVRTLGGEASESLLALAGLATRRDTGGLYDRLRDRIVFPIADRRGRVVGFGGRSIGDDLPKYLNSPETPVFHKGRELYGLALARAAGSARVLVVEGYMDVVALSQHGIRNSVATLGTAATAEQLKQLFRIWSDVVFCFDGDEAGRRAAWRALETTLPLMREGRQAKFMFLPDGEDPDSLVRARGAAPFEQGATEAISLGTFLFDELSAQTDLRTIDGRARLCELALPLLEKVPPGSFQRLAGRRLQELAGIDSEDLSALSKTAGGAHPSRHPVASSARVRGAAVSPARKAITLLVQHPELAAESGDVEELRDSALPGASLLTELVELLADHPDLTTAAIVERYRGHDSARHLASLAAAHLDLREGLDREFRDCLRRLVQQSRKRTNDERLKALGAKRVSQLSEEERREYARLTGSGRE